MSKFKNPGLRYLIIDRSLRRWKSVSTQTLREIIQRELDVNITLRSIQLDIETMMRPYPAGFDAPIDEDKKTHQYSYTDPAFSITTFRLKEEEIKAMRFYAACLKMYSEYSIFSSFSSGINKIVEGVNIRNRFQENRDADFIIQTDTIPNPHGAEYLSDIIEAIDEKKYMEFNYLKFSSGEIKKRVFAPYMLKEYKNRWYVIGVERGENKITTFALDRVSEPVILDQNFSRTIEFDNEKYFTHSFGITRPDAPVEEVVLRFTKNEAPYILSLPIHKSKKLIKQQPDYTDISISVIPSYELYEYILGKTPDVTVLSPQHVKESIKNSLRKGVNLYGKK
ncbi:MAG: hypothetical protein JWN76_2464 [Chitinophagaceae bacterium]|nr:hypothetical protein [Chitinophagaceae bacterium]